MTATEERLTYVEQMPIARIHADPINPRENLDIDEEFIASIRAGIVEPLVVRPDPSAPPLIQGMEGEFLLIAGERRYTAATIAELEHVPCRIIYDVDDAAVLEMMLVENDQRKSLTALEEASGYARLLELGRTQRQIEEVVGRAQGTISKRIALLKLPERAKALLNSKTISVKTAHSLVGLVKHNDRLAKVLDFATKGEHSDHDIAYRIERELDEVKADEQRAKRIKALQKRGLDLVDRDGTDRDEFANAWERCTEDEATAFDVDQWGYINFYKPYDDDELPAGKGRVDEDEEDDDNPGRERARLAEQIQAELVANLLDDGYPGADAAFRFFTEFFLADGLTDGWFDGEELCKALGLAVEVGEEEDDYSAEERTIKEAIATQLPRVALAAALGASRRAWGDGKRVRLAFLQVHGYELQTADERALFGDTVPDGGEVEVVDLTGPELVDTNAEVKAAPAPNDARETSEDASTGSVTTSTEGAATSATSPPWDGYEKLPTKLVVKQLKSKPLDVLRAVVAWENEHDERADVIDAATKILDGFKA